MEIKLVRNGSFNVSVQNNNKLNISLKSGGIAVPGKFRDLDDFDATNLQGDNIIIYDSNAEKFKTIPVDNILEISASDNNLPQSFTEKISEDIDLDAGEF